MFSLWVSDGHRGARRDKHPLKYHFRNRIARESLRSRVKIWKSIPDFFFKELGGLNFLLRCRYDTKYLDPELPILHKDILMFFADVRSIYNHAQWQETILFNDKDI